MRRTLSLAVGVGLLIGLGAGCNKFTPQRYQTIYVGQPAPEVEKTLGQPNQQFSDQWIYIHRGQSYYQANIYFESGRVIRKLWFDRQHMPDLPTQEELHGRPADSEPREVPR